MREILSVLNLSVWNWAIFIFMCVVTYVDFPVTWTPESY